jgi:hypothetical protein
MADTERTSFTQIVADLDAQGYNSMGFTIEGDTVVCLECDAPTTVADAKVGGLLGYEADGGEGVVLVMACPHCAAKGMLFAGPDLRNGPSGDVVDALADKART